MTMRRVLTATERRRYNTLELSERKEKMSGMNGIAPKIEIIAPFQTAFEWMKSMLFRPFDIGKWLTIAFAAFLAGGWAGGGNARGISKVANGDWRYRVTRHGDLGVDWDFTPWIISAAIGIFLIGLV